ncbi:hypothetical protein [Cereibacter changlensis]|uniref:hypothetical protein n=1 Tax=Cereibacter changlensis TaxID=402884 RepID=UPI00145E48C1|nr:hypothetical protein [Cereibacter changlensis]
MHILLSGNTAFKIAKFCEIVIRFLPSKKRPLMVLVPPDDQLYWRILPLCGRY